MNIPKSLKRYFQRNEDDLDELMRNLEKETSFIDSPSLSLLYGSYGIRKSGINVPTATKNEACISAGEEKK